MLNAAEKSSKIRTENTSIGFGMRSSLVSLVTGVSPECWDRSGKEIGDKENRQVPRCLTMNEQRHIGGSLLFNVKEPGEGRVEDKCEQGVINKEK